MQNILKNSVVYRIIASIYCWFSHQWENSKIISWFLSRSYSSALAQPNIFTRITDFFHKWLSRLFRLLRLDRLLKGSIFRTPIIWCTVTVVLAPLVPTKFVILLAAASLVSLFLDMCCDAEKKLVHTPLNSFIVLYVIIYFIAIIASVTFSGSLKGGLVTILFTLFAVVIQNSIRTQKQLDYIIYAVVIAGAAVSCYGIFQYLFGINGDSSWIDSSMFSDLSTRVYSTLDNPNVLSEYLLLVIPLSLACMITSKGAGSRIIFALFTAAMLLCMVLTLSRGGWLGLLIAMAIFLVMIDRRFILLGIVMLVALYFVLPDSIISRFTSIGNMGDTSTSYRVSIWLGSIDMIKDYWLCGIGPGSEAFNKIYPLYSYHSAVAQHSHNLYLQIVCDSGICGIIVFAVILFTFFRCVLSSMKRETDNKSKMLQRAVSASVTGFLVQSMTDFSFYNYRVMLMFWAVIGLGMLIARRTSLSEVKADD